MKRLVIDLSKPLDDPGRERLVDLTAAELADRQEIEAAAVLELQAGALSSDNEVTLRDRAGVAIANLQAAYDGWGALSAANKDAALRLTVRVVIALSRLVLRRLDSA